jgi:hypothetical protein
MSRNPMADKVAKVLGANPDLAFELYCQASEIVDDFDDHGPVLQGDENGDYSDRTTLRRLEAVRNRLRALIDTPEQEQTL